MTWQNPQVLYNMKATTTAKNDTIFFFRIHTDGCYQNGENYSSFFVLNPPKSELVCVAWCLQWVSECYDKCARFKGSINCSLSETELKP